MKITVAIPGMKIPGRKRQEKIVSMVEYLVKVLAEEGVVPVDSVFSIALRN